jgi:hypothetical protein
MTWSELAVAPFPLAAVYQLQNISYIISYRGDKIHYLRSGTGRAFLNILSYSALLSHSSNSLSQLSSLSSQ